MAQEFDISSLFNDAQDREKGIYAQILLAEAYLKGKANIKGVQEKNQTYLGKHWLKNAVSLLLQAKALSHYEKLSLDKLSQLAGDMCVEAQYQLALLNFSRKDDKENNLSTYTGIYWLYQAALQGHEKAIERLIIEEKEVSNYEKMKANYFLGLLYWDEKVIINGNKETNQKTKGLQCLYESARLDTGTYQRALDKLEELANGNDAEAQYKLAQLCFTGKMDFKESPEILQHKLQGLKWLYKAAISGHKDAMHQLETQQDISPMCGYEEFMEMQYTLGVMYLEGLQGVVVDSSKAVKYLEFADKNGSENGKLKLNEARSKLESIESGHKEMDADKKWIKDSKNISLSQMPSSAYTTTSSSSLKTSNENVSSDNLHEPITPTYGIT